MSDFVSMVRTGAIKSPFQRGYSEDAWTKAFKESDITPRAENLWRTGLWFDAQLRSVRSLLDTLRVSLGAIPSETITKLLVGFAVREWAVLSALISDRFKEHQGKEVSLMEITSPLFTSIWGSEFDGDAGIEVLVDSMRYPLSEKFDRISSETLEVKDTNIYRSIIKAYFLGQTYQVLDDYWLNCLWNDLILTKDDQGFIFKISNSSIEIIEAISLFRHELVEQEGFQHIANIEQSGHYQKFFSNSTVFSAFKRSGKFRIKLGDANRFRSSIRSLNASRYVHIPAFADEFLKIKQDKLCGLSLTILIQAYEYMGQVAEGILHDSPVVSAMEEADLEHLCPIILRKDLETCFLRGLKISTLQVDFVIDLMTHKRQLKNQLWFQPLIALDQSSFALVPLGIYGGNTGRLLHWLCSFLPNFESTMLQAFEKYVRERLIDSQKEFIARDVCYVYPKQLKFHGEEIDLVFSLGDNLFIAELKATLFSSDPMHRFHTKESLYGIGKGEARGQVNRKTLIVQNNLCEFLNHIDHPKKANGRAIKVLPLIMTSTRFLAGFPIEGIPVVDDLILFRYFKEGWSAIGAKNEGATIVPIQKQFFYTNYETAISNLNSYLERPPQVVRYESYTEKRKRVVMKVGGFEKLSTEELCVTYNTQNLRLEIENSK